MKKKSPNRPYIPQWIGWLAVFMVIGGFFSGAAAADKSSAPQGITRNEADLMAELEAEDAEDQPSEVSDPLYYWNKAVFQVNDKLYFWVLKPVATGYEAAVPFVVRTGVKNFFYNIATPGRFVNCLLQGKSEAAGVELGRFMVNTVFGGIGFWTPADREPSLVTKPPEEDLGQTLAVYGMGNGMFIMWPVLGPSTLRDTAGLLGDRFLDPLNQLNPDWGVIAVKAYERVNDLSFRLGDYEALIKASLVPYEAVRSGYVQYRGKKITE